MDQGEVKIAGVKATIATAGTAASYLTLNEWVALATLIYVVSQTIVLWCKFIKDRKNESHKK